MIVVELEKIEKLREFQGKILDKETEREICQIANIPLLLIGENPTDEIAIVVDLDNEDRITKMWLDFPVFVLDTDEIPASYVHIDTYSIRVF